MAPKRCRTSGGGHGQHKRKKCNLISIRQANDYRKYGEAHPADDAERPTKYTRVKDTVKVQKAQKNEVSSSSESEEEAPPLQQLLQEIGVKEDEPESEQEDSGDNSEEDDEEDESVLEKDDDEEEEEESILADSEEVEDDDCDFDVKNGRSFLDDEADEEEGDDDEEDDDGEEEEEEGGEDSEVVEDSDSGVEAGKGDKTVGKKEEISHSAKGKKAKLKDEQAKSKVKHGALVLDSSSDESNGDDDDDEDSEDILKESDPFSIHYETEVDSDEFLENAAVWMKMSSKVPGIGKGMFMYKNTKFHRDIKTGTYLKKLHVKHKLCDRVAATNEKFANVELEEGESFTSFQHNLFNVLNTYQDLLYPKQTVKNTEEIRLVYCFHALNHVLKTRSRIMAHNAKMKHKRGGPIDEDVEYRDQGLTRPKVVILLPYREKAKRVVNILIHLLSASDRLKAGSLNRFLEEFSEIETRPISARRYKAEDYLQMFEGNIDDNFRIGLSISKANIKLYTPLYASDIILASPLGLRTLIGDAGDEERDFDFLSSIEMLIMDQTDAFMMQNWDHVLHSLKHFHLQPKESHDVDFSRVRMWAIDGLSKFFRQTIIFGSVLLPEFISVFNRYCHNYCGKIMVEKIEKVGSVRSCLSDVPQIFHRVPCSRPDGKSQRSAKLDYFKKKILPLHTSSGMKRTLIYCDYFSFVTLRNFFREEDVFFLFIHEYDWEKDIKKNRIKFRKLSPPFMFYTERLHFHYRFRLRGVYHLLWFDLPQYPIFYPELINLMDVTNQACTSTCLFTKYEGQKLMEIVGQNSASHMLNSDKLVNMITVS